MRVVSVPSRNICDVEKVVELVCSKQPTKICAPNFCAGRECIFLDITLSAHKTPVHHKPALVSNSLHMYRSHESVFRNIGMLALWCFAYLWCGISVVMLKDM